MSRFFVDSQPEEKKESGLARNIYDIGAKVVTEVAGFPGNVYNYLVKQADIANEQLGFKPTHGVVGGISNILESVGVPREYLPDQGPDILSTQGLKKYAAEPIKKALFPQTHKEQTHPIAEKIGEYGSTIAQALLPPFGAKTLASVPAIIGRSVLGETGKQAAEYFGAGPKLQEASRVGSIVLGSLLGGKIQVNNAMKRAYAASEQSIQNHKLPKDLVNKTLNAADDFTEMLKERALDNKSYLKDTADSLKYINSKGDVPISKLWTLKNDINNQLGKLPKKSPEFRTTAQLSGIIDKTLRDYGEINTEFGKNYSLGQELFKGLQASTQASEFLRKNVNIKKLIEKPFAQLLLYTLSPHKAAAGLAGGIAIREAAKFHDLLTQSPHARKLMGDLLVGALQENSKAVIRNVIGLDKELMKDEGRFVINPS